MSLSEELRQKKICRFCLALPSADLKLTEIYGKSNKAAVVPLPLQIMAATGMEVYESDGLPTTICFKCRVFTLHAYKFKQMARKAEEQLRRYPVTGVWPDKLQLPFEQIVLDKPKTTKPLIVAPPPSKLRKLPTKPPVQEPDGRKIDILSLPVISVEQPDDCGPVAQPSPKPTVNKNPPKILNKCPTNANNGNRIEIISVVGVKQAIVPSVDTGPAIVLDSQVYACTECERSFPLRQLLDIHIKSHQRERNFPCQWCDKHFFSKYDLAKHTMTHTGSKPHTCQVCQKSFSRSTLLQRHQKSHSDAPKFLCTAENCEKYFLSADDLTKHMEAAHLRERKFQCKQCPKSFAFKQGLDRHEVNHSANLPFVCEYCDEGFVSSGKLARHLTTHTKYRRYPCKYCTKSFSLSHHLTRHLRAHNNNPTSMLNNRRNQAIQPVTQPYKCQYANCTSAFATKDNLIYHSAVHATESLMCPLCNEHFDDIAATTSHIELHSTSDQYPCNHCDLIFVSEEKLAEHFNAHHEVKEECEVETYTMLDVEPLDVEPLDGVTPDMEIQKAIQKLSKSVTVTREKKA